MAATGQAYEALPEADRWWRPWSATADGIDRAVRERCAGNVLLDLGCGPPEVRHAEADLSPGTCIAIDVSTTALPNAAAALEALPFGDEAVDCISCLSVIEHVYRPHAVIIAEMHRVLRPDGCMRVQVPFLIQYHGYPDNYFRYTHSALRRMIEESGFEVVQLETDWAKGTYLSAARCLEDGSFDFPGSGTASSPASLP